MNKREGNTIENVNVINIINSFDFACFLGTKGRDSKIVCPLASKFNKLKTIMPVSTGVRSK